MRAKREGNPNHGPDGKFASSDGGGKEKEASSKLAKFGKMLKALPGNVASSVKAKASAYYAKLSDKYGPTHAKKIIGKRIMKKQTTKRANAKHKDDGTFDHTDGNKAHTNNLAKCANVLGTMRPKTKQQVTSLADALFGKIQQPFDADTVLGVAIASMPPPVATHQVLAAGALGYLANKNNMP